MCKGLGLLGWATVIVTCVNSFVTVAKGLLLELNYRTNNDSCDSGVPPVDHHMIKLQLTYITLKFLLLS